MSDETESDIPEERPCGGSSRMFQIYADDFAVLEQAIPEFSDFFMGRLTPRLRTKLRRCKEILSNVRWNYGPHSNVERIDAGPPEDQNPV